MENNRINHKDYREKHTRIDKLTERPELPKNKSDKKYKEKKKSLPYYRCPFCQEELPEVVSRDIAKIFERRSNGCIGFGKRYRGFFSGIRASKCRNCGAREVYSQLCPCCKRDTWLKDGVYKHSTRRYHNCGFVGEKRK